MNRRTFLKSTASSTVLLATVAPWARCAEANAPRNDEDLLAQARERILKHRRSEGVILVRNAAGKPVPGASVKVEQQRHEFLFGCNFFRFARINDPQREQEYRSRFEGVFNFATLGFYWSSYEGQLGQPGYAYSEKTADWCRDHHITCKGHPLVWDHPAGSPRWLPEDSQELERLSNTRVRDIVTRFKGRIDVWDVVNEATHLSQHVNMTRMAKWGAGIGHTRYTAEPLRIARAANPQAKLIVNDYRVDPPFLKLLESLRENGRPLFDIVGIQSHMHGGGWPLANLWNLCDTYGKFDLPVHFTETTIVSGPRKGPGENWHPTSAEGEAKQSDYVPKFYTMLFAHPAMEAITWWDFSDDGAWQGAAAGWVRKDMSPKPVYERMHDLIKKQWWTKTEGHTSTGGEFKATAFHGTQRITVRDSGGKDVTREIAWRRGQPNQIEIVI
jgi:GH35 family endo-1,4-beta-xylanase